ncbi:putative cytochrome P450 oxidoreductase OrdA-like protein [Hypoxylon crocopeplum]|nr:putative cytochrome P450 oxidoreductase OrdA-like protein [Hypoxylon crocopeplum]
MASSSLIIGLGIGIALVYVLIRVFSNSNSSTKHLRLPPGPKGLPIVGNVFDLPKPGELETHHWLKHKDLYGPISSVTVMGQTLVIVNDGEVVLELLEKRSAKNSSRPNQIFLNEMVGWKNSAAASPYNARLRAYRTNLNRMIGNRTVASQYDSVLETEVGHFLLHVLESPEKLAFHVRKTAGTMVLKMAYGYTAESHQSDPLIDAAQLILDHFAEAAVPGAFKVDMFPFLRKLPDWLPGTGFKKLGRQYEAELTYVMEMPYAFTQHQRALGAHEPSLLSRLLDASDETPEELYTIKRSALSLFAGGADTTVSSMMCFFLAMTIFPDAQRQAQEEIDRVVGQDRLPNMADRDNLPYIEATVKEVLRWHPVAPIALPHLTTEEDIFEGYYIPKGAIIVPNFWAFTHDPNIYHDPMTFKPERYLGTGGREPEPDPRVFAFGFGRRVCAGSVFAENSLYLSIVQSLAVFNIKKFVENGREVDPHMEFSPGIISHPRPFKNLVEPRSPHHENLIRSLEKAYPWRKSDAEVLLSDDVMSLVP